MIYGNFVGGMGIERTYIIVDDNGNEITAVDTDDENVMLDATPNDIRLGTAAATSDGYTPGEKYIPSYNTEEGRLIFKPGQPLRIDMFSDQCQFTKLQAIICEFNTSIDDSISAVMVSIDGKVYLSGTSENLATVVVDLEKQSIDLSIVNDTDKDVVLRYFTYKEEP